MGKWIREDLSDWSNWTRTRVALTERGLSFGRDMGWTCKDWGMGKKVGRECLVRWEEEVEKECG